MPMQIYRILAIFKRYFFLSSKEPLRLVDVFYWPTFDIILWGFAGLWIQRAGAAGTQPIVLLTGLVFWQVVMRSLMEIALSFLEELWAQNLINLFATPVRISEWVVAVILLSVIKSFLTLLFGAFMVWLLYGIFILSTGLFLVPLFAALIICGWAFGFVSVSILVTAGQRAQSLVWIICWIFAPFCGVFYPIEILPIWAKAISSILPMTYLFEGMRLHMTTGHMPAEYWIKALTLAGGYSLMSLVLFLYLFQRSKINGLARLQVD